MRNAKYKSKPGMLTQKPLLFLDLSLAVPASPTGNVHHQEYLEREGKGGEEREGEGEREDREKKEQIMILLLVALLTVN